MNVEILDWWPESIPEKVTTSEDLAETHSRQTGANALRPEESRKVIVAGGERIRQSIDEGRPWREGWNQIVEDSQLIVKTSGFILRWEAIGGF